MNVLPLVRDVLPDVALSLAECLRLEGEVALADQVDRLQYHAPCGCDTTGCRSFYTAPKPAGSYGPRHRNILLDPPSGGLLIVDVVGSNIAFVEILVEAPA